MDVRSWDVAGDLVSFDARQLMRDERDALLRLITSLDDSAWLKPTVCSGWRVHDVALHLLGNDLGRLSAGRDGWAQGTIEELEFSELASSIEQSNEEWVRAMRMMSPGLLIDLLGMSGRQMDEYLAGVDLRDKGTPVAWTGIGPSPFWLDIAREYTERWVHHQQIREAVGQPIMRDRRWLHPVLDTFMRALPRAYATVDAEVGSSVRVEVLGDAGGAWNLRRDIARWRLVDSATTPDAEVQLPEDVAWRLLTRMLSVKEAAPHITSRGLAALAEPASRAVAIMTTSV